MFQLLAVPRFAVSRYIMGAPCTKPRLRQSCCGDSEVRLGEQSSSTHCIPPQLTVFVLDPTQIRYKEEFEKNKGKGFSVVADTPELQRIKKTQDQISNVSAF